MNEPTASCNELLSKTTKALSPEIIGIMLIAVQRQNVEISIKRAVER